MSTVEIERIEEDGRLIILKEIGPGPWYTCEMECTRCGNLWVLVHQGQQERFACPECGYLTQWPPLEIAR